MKKIVFSSLVLLFVLSFSLSSCEDIKSLFKSKREEVEPVSDAARETLEKADSLVIKDSTKLDTINK